MAVQLHDRQNTIGSVAVSRRVPAKGLLASLLGLRLPHCPDCSKRGMICRYTVPASYNEPAPRYFECNECRARYFRMATGPWFSAAGPQFARCYEMSAAQSA